MMVAGTHQLYLDTNEAKKVTSYKCTERGNSTDSLHQENLRFQTLTSKWTTNFCEANNVVQCIGLALIGNDVFFSHKSAKCSLGHAVWPKKETYNSVFCYGHTNLL